MVRGEEENGGRQDKGFGIGRLVSFSRASKGEKRTHFLAVIDTFSALISSSLRGRKNQGKAFENRHFNNTI